MLRAREFIKVLHYYQVVQLLVADAHRGSSWWVPPLSITKSVEGGAQALSPSRDVLCRIPQTTADGNHPPLPRQAFHIGPRERSDRPGTSTASLLASEGPRHRHLCNPTCL